MATTSGGMCVRCMAANLSDGAYCLLLLLLLCLLLFFLQPVFAYIAQAGLSPSLLNAGIAGIIVAQVS